MKVQPTNNHDILDLLDLNGEASEPHLVGLVLPSLWLGDAVQLEELGCACFHVSNGSVKVRMDVVLTRIPLPIKVILWITVASQLQPRLLPRRAVRKRNMIIRNVIKKMNLLLLQHQSSSNRVHRSITPSLVEESSVLIQGVEVVGVCLASEPVEIADLEVRPHVAVVVCLAAVVGEEVHGVSRCDVLRVVLHELLDAVPEGWDSLNVLVKRQHERVLLAVVSHELESIIVDIAEQFHARLHTPIPLIVEHQLLLKEEARLKATHMAIRYRITIDDLPLLHILTDLLRLLLINMWRERPVLLWNLSIVRLSRNQRSSDLLERLVERLVVEENPVVVELPVEAVLDLADRAGNLPQIGIASKSDEGSVHALAWDNASEACWSVWRAALSGWLLDALDCGFWYGDYSAITSLSNPSLSLTDEVLCGRQLCRGVGGGDEVDDRKSLETFVRDGGAAR